MTILKNIVISLIFSIPGIIIFFLLFYFELLSSEISTLAYRGVVLAVLAVVLQVVFLVLVSASLSVQKTLERALVGACALSFGFNVLFLIIFPVTIDRSVSVFLLSQISTSVEGLSKQELTDVFIADYVGRFDAVGRRVDEQIKAGNIELRNGKYVLSEQGKNFIRSSHWLADMFQTDPRMLNRSRE